jgi:3-hydroxyisobutyrate dehydrogenase
MANEIASVGFIGLGIMGRHMAGHILGGGYKLHVYNRSRNNAEPLLAKGAVWHDSPGALAPHCDAIVTIVGYPADVEQVYLSAEGLVAKTKPGSVLIDATTSSPSLAVRIAAEAVKKGITVLDAPVSGGDVGAREAKLAIMVGGDSAAFERVKPVLDRMGKNIALMGGAGAGQHTKMANQIAIASTMMGVSECLAYSKKAGLDAEAVLKLVGSGAASSFLLNGLGPRMAKGDYAAGFYVKHFIKDLGIALTEADQMKLSLPGLALAKQLYDKLAAQGYGDDGTQALYRLYAVS